MSCVQKGELDRDKSGRGVAVSLGGLYGTAVFNISLLLCCSCPVVSLSYVPRAASAVFPCGGVLAGTLEGACFWEMSDAQYKPHLLPLEPGGCTDIQTESSTRHCLVTYRPGK